MPPESGRYGQFPGRQPGRRARSRKRDPEAI